ncbi:hypothetical protein PspLS_00172 [Pyricularia sp. CBS 133598]|nr:hypothetical protein PspLS_00172 [Pyricularia sp. CBS 133598]
MGAFTSKFDRVSVVNGVTQFSATPVSTNPAGVPILVYKCANTPALCENVNQRNLLNMQNGRLTTLQGP